MMLPLSKSPMLQESNDADADARFAPKMALLGFWPRVEAINFTPRQPLIESGTPDSSPGCFGVVAVVHFDMETPYAEQNPICVGAGNGGCPVEASLRQFFGGPIVDCGFGTPNFVGAENRAPRRGTFGVGFQVQHPPAQ
jgi:hypothetical protein